MRSIETHKSNGCNEQLTITATDEPGAGGACHRYEIRGFNTGTNPAIHPEANGLPFDRTHILFQNGPIPEVGVNGVTIEVLLAIVIDRLICFQAGPYACTENAIALEHILLGLDALNQRTAKRVARGVEGTREL